MVKGVRFEIDEQVEKTAVLIDLNEHGELTESGLSMSSEVATVVMRVVKIESKSAIEPSGLTWAARGERPCAGGPPPSLE